MDERLRRGIREFNDERFFEAHEVWEELWHEYRGTDRTFIQGLIHLAAGLYHCQCENEKGAVSQLNKGIQKLQNYVPEYSGVPLELMLKRVEAIAGQMYNGAHHHTPFPKLLQNETQPTQS